VPIASHLAAEGARIERDRIAGADAAVAYLVRTFGGPMRCFESANPVNR
jgi:hypothetical protein